MIFHHKGKKTSNIINILIALYTCALAPLVSHLLDLLLVDNKWTTEYILLLYLSSLSGYIIIDKLVRFMKESGLYEKGFKLGDSDAFTILAWQVPILLIINNYESVISVCILIAIIVMAIVILYFDIDKITIDIFDLAFVGFFCLITIFSSMYGIYGKRAEMSSNRYLLFLGKILISQLVVCGIFDLFAIMYKKKKRSNREE